MKVISAEVTNFGSYKHLRFDFDNLGLALVHGPTGSGKSTLMDIIPWVLFGTTAKNGAADDVRSWQANDEVTTGTLELDRNTKVVRTRGKGKNDLYWIEAGSSDCNRGKDLLDTQKLLEARLSVDSDTYLSSAYLHEFSKTSAFFTATAKARRELFESIASLQFPRNIAIRSSEYRKGLKLEFDSANSTCSRLQGMQMQLEASEGQTQEACQRWQSSQQAKIQDLKAKADAFDSDKAIRSRTLLGKADSWALQHSNAVDTLIHLLEQLEGKVKSSKQLDLDEAHIRNKARCTQCGSLPENINEALREHQGIKFANNQCISDIKSKKVELKRLVGEINPYEAQYTAHKEDTNVYSLQYDKAKKESNPFDSQLVRIKADLSKNILQLKELTLTLSNLTRRIDALTQLQELSAQLRAALLQRSIQSIEVETNRILETHFDGEFRIGFAMTESDDLSVSIHKSGYECNYRQLSKGQRQMLKLSFGLAVMQASSDQAGTHFNCVMLDEALDGFDPELKVKAYGLLEELSTKHDTVLVIDHSPDLQTMFTTKFEVRLQGDYSEIQQS